jgi:hypothetical protein
MRTNKLYGALITFILLLATLLTGNLILTRTVSESAPPLDLDSPPTLTQLYDDETLGHDASGRSNQTIILPSQIGWEKQVWINGNQFLSHQSPFTGLLTTDSISIVDSVMITHTGNISFTLEEDWSNSLVFTAEQHISGTLIPPPIQGPGTVTWTVQNDIANTWYVLTKTFAITPSSENVDYITETLWVDDAASQPASIHLTFCQASYVLITGATFEFSPGAPMIDDTITFSGDITPSNATPPIVYTWDFGDGSPLESGAFVMHTFPSATIIIEYPVTITASNVCSSAEAQQLVTVRPYYMLMPFVSKQYPPDTGTLP